MTKTKGYIILVIFGLLLSIGYVSDKINKTSENEKDISPTPRKMTFRGSKASLPPFLLDVWPPPGAEFSLETYNNNYKYHYLDTPNFDDFRSYGIGVQIDQFVIDDPPPVPESEKHIKRAKFYLDGKDVQELKKKDTCNQLFRGTLGEYYNEQWELVRYLAGEILIICYPELTIGKHEIKFTVKSLKGEMFEYTWEFTVTGNLLLENLDVIYGILATVLIVIIFVIFRRRNVLDS